MKTKIVGILLALSVCTMPSWARDKKAGTYPLSGKVLAVSPKREHWYQVATDSRVYLLLCERTKGVHFSMPECKINDRPIAVDDTVQFCVDGDRAYLPDVKGEEQELSVLTEEFKTMPVSPQPAAGESGQGSNAAVRGMVIGDGIHIAGDKHMSWSLDPSSVSPQAPNLKIPGQGMMASRPAVPTGPVLAVPATGGAPVLVSPTAPAAGGVVTGVPVTGGAPIVGIPVGGAAMAGGGAPHGGGPPMVHVLHVQAGKDIYTLECSVKPCNIDKKQIELGDMLTIRTEKKWAYVSLGTGSEQKLRILSDKEEDEAPAAK